MRMNARLMFSASPKPTASAMRSTGSAVVSMRPRARSARSRSTTRAGVVLVCARNARLNWRRLMLTASAKRSAVAGSDMIESRIGSAWYRVKGVGVGVQRAAS